MPQPPLAVSLPADEHSVVVRWFMALRRLICNPRAEYLVIILLLGALRAGLFPAAIAHAGANPATLVGLASPAPLFLSTAGRDPTIIQTTFGLGAGAAGVLLLTLAPLSLPSLVMLSRSFPLRVLAALAGLTAVAGLTCGLAAMALHL